MTAKDIETLCRAFYNLPFEELHALDNAQFPWLPRVNGLSLLAAVDTIRGALEATQDETERLNHVVTLYAWLAPRGIFGPWALHRLGANLEDVRPTNIMNMLATAMRHRVSGSVGRIIDAEGAVYFIVMTTDALSGPLEHTLMCFCIKHGLPFLAVHAPGDLLRQAKIWVILSLVLGDPRNSIRGTYDNLRSAFSAVA